MSVINQMLKDLDKRQAQQASPQDQINLVQASALRPRLWFIVVGLVIINIAGWLFWQMYTENKQLKHAEQVSKLVTSAHATQLAKPVENDSSINSLKRVVASNNQPTPDHDAVITKAGLVAPVKLSAKIEPQAIASKPKVEPEAQPASLKVVQTSAQFSKQMSVSDKPPVSQVPPAEQIAAQSSAPLRAPHVESQALAENDQPRMTITRETTTAKQLAQQKMQQAQTAMADNNLSLAEQLLSDVLILKPQHKEARKQLAALWFGRQAYQAAINVLEQGIALSPNYAEFRLMQARIYVKQREFEQAYQTMDFHLAHNNVEYLTLFAGIAQQLKHFSQAAIAYTQLTTLQPTQARWWLGLGIAQDSQGLYSQAKFNYQSALAKQNLTDNAKRFIEQRLPQLGE